MTFINDAPDNIKYEINNILFENKEEMSIDLARWIKLYSHIQDNNYLIIDLLFDENNVFGSKKLHFAKLAIKNGCYFNKRWLNDFSTFTGLTDAFSSDYFIIKPLNSDFIDFIDYINKEIYINILDNVNLDISSALCWTGQLDLLIKVKDLGFLMEKDMLFTCILGLCYENEKKYEERLNIIKWAIENKLPKYERYLEYTDYESISSITSYDNPNCQVFIVDQNGKFIDSWNVDDSILRTLELDKESGKIEEYCIMTSHNNS